MDDVFTGAVMSDESKNVFMGREGLHLPKKAKTEELASPELDLSHLEISEFFEDSLEDSLEDFFKESDQFFDTHYVQPITLLGSCFGTNQEIDLHSPLSRDVKGIMVSNDRLWYLCCLLKDLAMKQKKELEELKK